MKRGIPTFFTGVLVVSMMLLYGCGSGSKSSAQKEKIMVLLDEYEAVLDKYRPEIEKTAQSGDIAAASAKFQEFSKEMSEWHQKMEEQSEAIKALSENDRKEIQERLSRIRTKAGPTISAPSQQKIDPPASAQNG